MVPKLLLNTNPDYFDLSTWLSQKSIAIMSASLLKMIASVKQKLSSYPNKSDVMNLLEICDLYDTSSLEHISQSTSLDMSTSEESESIHAFHMREVGQLSCKEFVNKYKILIHVVFVCLHLEIPIFTTGKFPIFINTRQLMNNICTHRKKLYLSLARNLTMEDYQVSSETSVIPQLEQYGRELAVLENIAKKVSNIISRQVIDDCDSLMQMILPYFQEGEQYNEVYQ